MAVLPAEGAYCAHERLRRARRVVDDEARDNVDADRSAEERDAVDRPTERGERGLAVEAGGWVFCEDLTLRNVECESRRGETLAKCDNRAHARRARPRDADVVEEGDDERLVARGGLRRGERVGGACGEERGRERIALVRAGLRHERVAIGEEEERLTPIAQRRIRRRRRRVEATDRLDDAVSPDCVVRVGRVELNRTDVWMLERCGREAREEGRSVARADAELLWPGAICERALVLARPRAAGEATKRLADRDRSHATERLRHRDESRRGRELGGRRRDVATQEGARDVCEHADAAGDPAEKAEVAIREARRPRGGGARQRVEALLDIRLCERRRRAHEGRRGGDRARPLVLLARSARMPSGEALAIRVAAARPRPVDQ